LPEWVSFRPPSLGPNVIKLLQVARTDVYREKNAASRDSVDAHGVRRSFTPEVSRRNAIVYSAERLRRWKTHDRSVVVESIVRRRRSIKHCLLSTSSCRRRNRSSYTPRCAICRIRITHAHIKTPASKLFYVMSKTSKEYTGAYSKGSGARPSINSANIKPSADFLEYARHCPLSC